MSRLLSASPVAALALLLLQPRFVTAQEAIDLKYDPPLEVGTTYDTELEVKSDQILTLAGMPLETHGDTFMTLSEKVVGPSGSGGWTFDGKFALVQSDLELPGGMKVSFNSNNPDQADTAGPLAMIVDALKAMAGAEWKAETNAEHELTKMEYIDDPFANIDELLKGDASPEAIKKRRKTELQRYPSEAVKPGDTWTRTEESDLGGGQTITMEKEYTYAGSEERDGRTFDKVTVKVLKVEYEMDNNSPSPAKVTESDLEVESSEGTFWYDRKLQLYSDMQEKVRMTGTLSVEVNDQKLPGELDLTIEVGVTTKLMTP